jgi:two-component system response regulator AtoC
MACRIVVVTERSAETEALRAALAEKGHEVAEVGLSEMEDHRPGLHDIVLAVGHVAVETCEALLRRHPGAAVIVLDSEPNMRRAVAALRAGAADFVTDPTSADAVDAAIQRVFEKRILSERLNRLGSVSQSVDERQQDLVGESVAMRQVRSRIERLKGADSTVLITGESGTGRDAVARILHEQSTRRSRPFIAVNCSTMTGQLESYFGGGHATGVDPESGGLIGQAGGGALFLDEIEKIPLGAQSKLYAAIEQRGLRPLEGNPDLSSFPRLIAASNVDLADEVAAGRFREQLFDRLSVVQIRLPPLRERGLDTLLLAQHFVERYAGASGRRVVGMTLGAARMLMAHDWPGNVRELGAWIEAAVALARHDHITEADLLSNWTGVRGSHERSSNDDTLMSWNSLEARHIASILEEAGGNKARAARLLGIDRKTLYRKLERYGLDTQDRFRRAH